ncbi:MAG: hypothetical protein CK530_08345 [Planctomycetaceae bacterium]|nr:MAG: hypothetical protein CK530_08345 [Planctomycetaceae bacterium]
MDWPIVAVPRAYPATALSPSNFSEPQEYRPLQPVNFEKPSNSAVKNILGTAHTAKCAQCDPTSRIEAIGSIAFQWCIAVSCFATPLLPPSEQWPASAN